MEENLLYHYTDINALANMLREDGVLFRATNIFYVNDKEEIKQGMGLIKDYVEKHIDNQKDSDIKQIIDVFDDDIFFDFYLISFSKCENDLNMWRSYADNGKGCALCFSQDEIEKECAKLRGYFAQCCYDKNEINKEIAQYFDPIINNENDIIEKAINHEGEEFRKLVSKIVEIGVKSKHSCFCNEEEWRGVFLRHEHNKKGEEIRFKVKSNCVVPYTEVCISKKALTKIIIGPTFKPEETKESVKDMLEILDYNQSYGETNVIVDTSELPYRW